MGILFKEKVDHLAQGALQDDTMDPGPEYTLDYVNSSIKDFVHSTIGNQLDLCCHREVTVVFTMYVSPRVVLTRMKDIA